VRFKGVSEEILSATALNLICRVVRGKHFRPQSLYRSIFPAIFSSRKIRQIKSRTALKPNSRRDKDAFASVLIEQFVLISPCANIDFVCSSQKGLDCQS
jgi:hypothetical protein